MITAGIDVGTKDSCVVVSEDGRVLDYTVVENLKDSVLEIVRFLKDHNPNAIGCGFGYGLPIKRLSEIDEKDFACLTLSFGREIMGVRSLLRALKDNFGDVTYTIPSVKLLPTVPAHRKFNRIDMGTSDKVCSTALAMVRLGRSYEEQNFVLIEGGYGFNSFIAVKNGKIVDGLGGTSGFLSFSSSGSLDLEVLALMKGYSKELIFQGGLKSFIKCDFESIPDYALEWLFEYILKGVKVMEAVLGSKYDLVVSGRMFDLYWREFEEFIGRSVFKIESVKSSAEGASIVANGIANGIYHGLVKHLELDNAKGSILDHISEDLRKLFKFPIEC